MKKIILIFAVTFIGFAAMAQTKTGYINSKELMTSLPESRIIDSTYKKYYEALTIEVKALSDELNTKSELFIKDSATYLPSIKELRLNDLVALNGKLKAFQEQAGKDLKSKGDSLLTPLYNKINKAISEVARENSYDFIVESSNLVYVNEKYNIIKLVQKKLGK